MNIPIGAVEEEHVSFADSSPFAKVGQLLDSGFSGYLVATVEGASGLEEGLLLIRDSAIVASVFDALRISKQLQSVKALKLVLNLLKAKKGVFDVNRLSKQQIDLILAFNENIKLPKPLSKDLFSRMEPHAYDPGLVSKELVFDLDAKDTRYNLLKKLGLGSI